MEYLYYNNKLTKRIIFWTIFNLFVEFIYLVVISASLFSVNHVVGQVILILFTHIELNWIFMWIKFLRERVFWVTHEAFYISTYRDPIKFDDILDIQDTFNNRVEILFKRRLSHYSLFLPSFFYVKKVKINQYDTYDREFLKVIQKAFHERRK